MENADSGKGRTLRFSAGMSSPPLDPAHKLHPVLGAGLKRKDVAPEPAPAEASSLWPAAFFGLDRVSAFREAPEEARRRILAACAEGLLEESYFIEKGGFNFNAKMILLSETTEEKMLYSLFASDEAAHLALVEPYLPGAGTRRPKSPFLALMSGACESGGHASLVYLLQVLLEGWGLTHYRSLADGCADPGLGAALKRIVKDEAVHHAGGVALHDPAKLAQEDREFILAAVRSIFEMVRVGPQAVVGAAEAVLGGGTRKRRERMFAELDCETQAAARLTVLRSLMEDVDSKFVMPVVDSSGWMRPYTAAQCAAWSPS